MCGIFGVAVRYRTSLSLKRIHSLTENLLNLSQSRGQDASGVAVVLPGSVTVLKRPIPASKLIKTSEFQDLLTANIKFPLAIIGQARMETNGSYNDSNNNQPVIKDGVITLHNGIIVNDTKLWNDFPELRRDFQVDTEIFNSLLNFYLKNDDLVTATQKVFSVIEGSASIGCVFTNLNVLLLATNTGSLYFSSTDGLIAFASEEYILVTALHKINIKPFIVLQLKAEQGVVINLSTLETSLFSLASGGNNTIIQRQTRHLFNILPTTKPLINIQKVSNYKEKLQDILDQEYTVNIEKISHLRRCTKCILPETMPFIEFDEFGVCNFCNNYKKIDLKNNVLLEEWASNNRHEDGKPDCIVAFSGGRDSSYGLHYLKNVLKMHPVAYSYDWGMLTDLGRRNQARMCGKLGVEHILISADIHKKRENIRKNVSAWLKRPDLGTVPLFMAGDKQYFYFANVLKKQMAIDTTILCECPLEQTNFKSGFCGIPPKIDNGKFYSLPIARRLQMVNYYAREGVRNPSLINSSFLDSIGSFLSYYFIPHDFLSIYEYVRWDEETINNTLKDYGWETDLETPTTWRIGDGTAAFYNYIYLIMAGFTEHDTFRSNQIREGSLTRKEALEKVIVENKPRIDSLLWYGNTIGLDILEVVQTLKTVRFGRSL